MKNGLVNTLGMGFFEYFGTSEGAYTLYFIVMVSIIPMTIIGVVVSMKVNSTFAKYSNMPSNIGFTAAEAARRILNDNGLNDIAIRKISGHLSDNFNPKTKVISLSESVYGSTSVAAICVACHEAGHAIQHAKKYFFASARMALVPVINIANQMLFPLLLVGMLLGFASPYTQIGSVFVWVGVIIFGLSALFALITLPTEFNASSRALKALKVGYLSGEEVAAGKKVLNAAAMTYVVSFLISLLQFLRFFAMILMSRNRNR